MLLVVLVTDVPANPVMLLLDRVTTSKSQSNGSVVLPLTLHLHNALVETIV